MLKDRSETLRWWSGLIALVLIAGSTGAEAAEKIRFAFQDRIGSVIPIVAVEKGFFDAEGLAIEPLRFSSGPACAEALYSGAADISTMGDTTAIIMVTRNPSFVIIASHATGEHRHRIMVRRDSPLERLEHLKGKSVGVKKGTSTFGGLLDALGTHGVDPAGVRIIDLTPPTMTTALLAGSLDAFAASEPTPSIAEAQGARELITLGGLGNVYPILMVTRRETLQHKKTTLQLFLRALAKAQADAAAHPEETAGIMAAQTGLAMKTTHAAMQRHHYEMRLDKTILTSLERTARFLKDQQIIDSMPDLDVSTDRSLLEQCIKTK